MDLHHEYHFLLDGESSLNHHIRVEERPSIPAPSRKWNEYGDVLSKNGTMRKAMDAFEEIEFELKCNFACDEYRFNDTWRKIKDWLLSDSAEREFQESYDLHWFYKVSKIEVSEIERVLWNGGQFTITITVEPFSYAVSGNKWLDVDDIAMNHYYKCEPLWQILNTSTKQATCTITVNGQSFDITNINVGETKFVDVEKRITYAADTSNYYIRSGRYGQEEYLTLQHGYNNISCSSGFKVLVKPRWRAI